MNVLLNLNLFHRLQLEISHLTFKILHFISSHPQSIAAFNVTSICFKNVKWLSKSPNDDATCFSTNDPKFQASTNLLQKLASR
ncbi:hypothetical protein T07_12818 [Trichinella nelsoni]|uniref:Uncharacterized protein n=1 Tax=Trichinella nelsoni TaxID=6336 RepID=A0A0V0SMV2_9BILA|nr:hypothetical protein T07_12818 [Trichinella nelsoni]